jgi:serine protease inhibitor
MSKEDLVNALGNIDEAFIDEARPKGRARFMPRVLAAAAALLVLAGAALALPRLIKPKHQGGYEAVLPTEQPASDSISNAGSIPEDAIAPVTEDDSFVPGNYVEPVSGGRNSYLVASAQAVNSDESARLEAAENSADTGKFAGKLFSQLLSESPEENLVFSPVNIYIELAMLAQTAGGETRGELLSLLGAHSVRELREGCRALIEAESMDEAAAKCALANALWLNDSFGYYADTLDLLAEYYGASSFWGDPSDIGFTMAKREWLNEKTNGFLKDSIDPIIQPAERDTLLDLTSTVYLKKDWRTEFKADRNRSMVFHAPAGDGLYMFMVDLMEDERCFIGESFVAGSKSLVSGEVWFLLPNEGVSIAEALEAGGMEFLLSDKSNAESGRVIELYLPKFDFSRDFDLMRALSALGLSSCFDSGASDFSNLTQNAGGLCVTDLGHSARILVDEEGVEAGAFTDIWLDYNPMANRPDKLELKLDRPFVFVITGVSGEPLFMGVVTEPVQ